MVPALAKLTKGTALIDGELFAMDEHDLWSLHDLLFGPWAYLIGHPTFGPASLLDSRAARLSAPSQPRRS